MNHKPSQKPNFFPIEIYLGLNNFKNNIGNIDYLYLKENIFCFANDSYKIINKKEHILLNHLFQKKKKINSMSIRYRHKNSTFIYYK